MNSCLWIIFFIIVFSVEISKNFTFSLVIPCIFIFLKQVHLFPQNLFALLKASFIQHHIYEKWQLNYKVILDGFIHIGITVTQKKFVLANKIKKTVITWLLLCCFMTVCLFLILLVTVTFSFNSFATNSFIEEHKICAFSFFSFRGLPEEKSFVKYSVKCITYFLEANLRAC